MKIQRFEDLECWQQARKLVNMIYETIKLRTPFQKDFQLVKQITGAAISVMNNVVEGWAAQSNAEFIRFLTYSRRSCAETQNCAYVAFDQEYITEDTFNEIYNQALKEIKIIDGLLRYLRNQRPKRSKHSQRSQKLNAPITLNAPNNHNAPNDLNSPNEQRNPK